MYAKQPHDCINMLRHSGSVSQILSTLAGCVAIFLTAPGGTAPSV